jgi:hypothetical protein
MLALRLVGRAAASRLGALRTPINTSRRLLCTPTTPPADVGMIQRIQQQVASEIAGAQSSPAKFYGFFGACCNWFLGLSAVYDASSKGPEVISLKMTGVMICYSTLFGRWAGWAVTPRNYILAASHIFNVIAQCNQLRRVLLWKLEVGGEAARKEIADLATKGAIGAAVVGACVLNSSRIQSVVAPYGPAYLSSAGGPFTIHPWPPVTKLAISGTSLLELDRPTDKISFSQYAAVSVPSPSAPCASLGCPGLQAEPDPRSACCEIPQLTLTGALFSRYGLVVTPINYPLTSVNVLLFGSSAWHLGRKIKADYM